jgi:PST family polysaccharide transporter
MIQLHNLRYAERLSFFKSVFGKRFARNWSVLTLSKLSCQLLGVMATIRVARTLSPQNYGLFSLVQTTAFLGLVLAGFGLRQVIIRIGSRHPEQSGHLVRSSIALLLISGCVVNSIILFFGPLISDSLSVAISAIIVGFVFGLLLWEIMESIAFANERAQDSASINFFGSLLWTTFVWICPESWLDITTVCLVFACIQCMKSLAFYYIEKRNLASTTTTKRYPLSRLVSESLPFYWLALFSVATIQLPIIILAKGSGMVEVGFYGAAQRVIDPLNIVIYSGILMLYPVLSKAAFINSALFMDRLKYFISILVVIGSAFAMFVSFFKYEITFLLFGPQFESTADTLAILAWMPLLANLFALIACVLSSLKKQRWLAVFSMVQAIVSLPIIWYGSKFGSTGLAVAMVIAATINIGYQWVLMEQALPSSIEKTYKRRWVAIMLCWLLFSVLGSETLPILFKLFVWFLLLTLCTYDLANSFIRQHSHSTSGAAT